MVLVNIKSKYFLSSQERQISKGRRSQRGQKRRIRRGGREGKEECEKYTNFENPVSSKFIMMGNRVRSLI